ncbi:DUF4413 domain-containing protein [Cephalotus follicularis]|uniref:DUF4413 domain-containing protein n=1 Tax=Cephalotus follicularis TaxID=3775 RepID=A0A1Q3C2H6_CEPFO|nr:DUF4413 domain-containing protein [Cephalotus follicularis]
MAKTLKVKFDKCWRKSNLLISIAVILDPRNKMKLIEFCFPSIYYLIDVANKYIAIVRKNLYDLYEEYVTAHFLATLEKTTQGDGTDGGSSSQLNVGKGRSSGRSMFDMFIRSMDSVEYVKSELYVYLEENVYICDETVDSQLDVLDFGGR